MYPFTDKIVRFYNGAVTRSAIVYGNVYQHAGRRGQQEARDHGRADHER